MTDRLTPRLTSLAAIETEIWEELARCVRDKQHAWRAPVLATTDGSVADARVVILREVDIAQRQLLAFTDDRAPKVDQLLGHPQGTLVMWSPQRSWQLRCHVRLTMENSGLSTTSRWARIKLSVAAQDYLSRHPPGTAIDAAEPPTADPLEREHFGVIRAQVESIDWLELHPEGHHRAMFDADGARWLQR